MNVMKKAHETARNTRANFATYRLALSAALKEAHKEYKAMNKEMTAEQIEIIESLKKSIASYKEAIANTSYSAYFLFHTEANIILTENEEKTRLSWGSIHNAVKLEKRIADAYCRKYQGPIKPVHAVTYLEDAVKEMEKLIK